MQITDHSAVHAMHDMPSAGPIVYIRVHSSTIRRDVDSISICTWPTARGLLPSTFASALYVLTFPLGTCLHTCTSSAAQSLIIGPEQLHCTVVADNLHRSGTQMQANMEHHLVQPAFKGRGCPDSLRGCSCCHLSVYVTLS
jgi:hypothetical protein